MSRILLLFAVSAFGQTLPNPDQVPWQQVDWTFCGSPAHSGTQIRLWQIKAPPGALDLCWPQSLSVAAWSVITTRCTRCHGETGPPPDTLLTFANIRGEVGNLDMRDKEAILTGGFRGPALKPRDPLGSLIYLFASRFQLGAGAGGNSTIPETQKFQLMDTFQGAEFRIVPPDSNEKSMPMPPHFPLTGEELKALRDWIAAGAPSPL
jgi:hypothetical protein